jgi:hypothetical protein
MFRKRIGVALLSLFFSMQLVAYDLPPFALHTNDVVAFVGGSDVAAAQFTGHLETLLAVKFPKVRFRNFGWDGDTVFAQPRDINFPPLTNHLRRAGVSVIFLQYGRAEALESEDYQTNFEAAYEKLLNQCSQQTPRVVLVTPHQFEAADKPLPDLSRRNRALSVYSVKIRSLAIRQKLPVVDLFEGFEGTTHKQPQLTENGLQLSPRGHALIAKTFTQYLGFEEIAAQAGGPDSSGRWPQPAFEKLRQLIVEKNKLWFNYWRPQNWAFLGGDRTTQPSSRDHRDPKVRWFPAEMEKFLPLIAAKESEIEIIAAGIRDVK